MHTKVRDKSTQLSALSLSLSSPPLCVVPPLSSPAYLCTTDKTCVHVASSNQSSIVQCLRAASRCSPTLLTPEVPQPQPMDSCSRGEGEGEGRGSLHRHRGTWRDHLSISHPSEIQLWRCVWCCDVCGVWVCCFHILQTVLCTQHRPHCVDQHCISLYCMMWLYAPV